MLVRGPGLPANNMVEDCKLDPGFLADLVIGFSFVSFIFLVALILLGLKLGQEIKENQYLRGRLDECGDAALLIK